LLGGAELRLDGQSAQLLVNVASSARSVIR